MSEYDFLRWERLKDNNIDLSYIKSIVRENYRTEIKERNLNLR